MYFGWVRYNLCFHTKLMLFLHFLCCLLLGCVVYCGSYVIAAYGYDYLSLSYYGLKNDNFFQCHLLSGFLIYYPQLFCMDSSWSKNRCLVVFLTKLGITNVKMMMIENQHSILSFPIYTQLFCRLPCWCVLLAPCSLDLLWYAAPMPMIYLRLPTPSLIFLCHCGFVLVQTKPMVGSQ